jgi:tetratricopeptide (TPR) repeat protein
LLQTLGRTFEALQSNAKSVEIAEGLIGDELGYRGLLSQILGRSGNLLLRTGRVTEALKQLRRSLELQEAFARAHPELIGHQTVLTNILRGVGRAEAAAGRSGEALAAFERASEVDLPLAEKYPVCRYNLACSLALMLPFAPPDRRDDIGRGAMDALRRAWAEGYANLAIVTKDDDLNALRDRPDFQDFLLDIAFPTYPFTQRN